MLHWKLPMSEAVCNSIISTIQSYWGNLNVYDTREKCSHGPLCYDFSGLDKLLQEPEVRNNMMEWPKPTLLDRAIWVIMHSFITLFIHDYARSWNHLEFAMIKWRGRNAAVKSIRIFRMTGSRHVTSNNDITHIYNHIIASLNDFFELFRRYLPDLLEAGIDVLVYAGTEDFICNYLGQKDWTHALKWSQRQQFNEQPLHEWKVNSKVAGRFKSAGPLTYLEVRTYIIPETTSCYRNNK